jgi:hypothetical protein
MPKRIRCVYRQGDSRRYRQRQGLTLIRALILFKIALICNYVYSSIEFKSKKILKTVKERLTKPGTT